MSIPDAHQRLAVLFDAENITPKQLPEIISRIDTYGQTIIKRAYADWMLPQFSAWRSKLHKYDIVPIQTLRIVSGKNLADIALTVDAMDILNEGIVDGICIVSSDSDFTPLVRRLQDGGLFVMGIGKVQTPEPFMGACNKFLKLEDVKKSQQPKQPKSIRIKPILDEVKDIKARQLAILLIQAISIANTKWISLSTIGTNLKSIDKNFNIKNYGFSTLGKGIEAFPNLFQIQKQGTTKSVMFKGRNLANLLIQAIKIADTPLVSLSVLGKNLRSIDATFNIKTYGFPSLGKAVQAFPKLFQIEKQRGANYIKLM